MTYLWEPWVHWAYGAGFDRETEKHAPEAGLQLFEVPLRSRRANQAARGEGLRRRVRGIAANRCGCPPGTSTIFGRSSGRPMRARGGAASRTGHSERQDRLATCRMRTTTSRGTGRGLLAFATYALPMSFDNARNADRFKAVGDAGLARTQPPAWIKRRPLRSSPNSGGAFSFAAMAAALPIPH